jgi:hypothetical protein
MQLLTLLRRNFLWNEVSLNTLKIGMNANIIIKTHIFHYIQIDLKGH